MGAWPRAGRGSCFSTSACRDPSFGTWETLDVDGNGIDDRIPARSRSRGCDRRGWIRAFGPPGRPVADPTADRFRLAPLRCGRGDRAGRRRVVSGGAHTIGMPLRLSLPHRGRARSGGARIGVICHRGRRCRRCRHLPAVRVSVSAAAHLHPRGAIVVVGVGAPARSRRMSVRGEHLRRRRGRRRGVRSAQYRLRSPTPRPRSCAADAGPRDRNRARGSARSAWRRERAASR